MNNRGFTLIELMLVIVITAVISSIAGFTIYQGYKSYATAETLTPFANKGSAALSFMNTDLNNAVQFTAIGSQSMTFVNTSAQTITYTYASNTLTRQVTGGSATTLTNELTGLTFKYYSTALAETATPSAVRLVTIQMTFTGSFSSTFSIINSVFPRNAS
jgi:prepilin-type N-terminal cleavage/methylation domain-containing protein